MNDMDEGMWDGLRGLYTLRRNLMRCHGQPMPGWEEDSLIQELIDVNKAIIAEEDKLRKKRLGPLVEQERTVRTKWPGMP